MKAREREREIDCSLVGFATSYSGVAHRSEVKHARKIQEEQNCVNKSVERSLDSIGRASSGSSVAFSISLGFAQGRALFCS